MTDSEFKILVKILLDSNKGWVFHPDIGVIYWESHKKIKALIHITKHTFIAYSIQQPDINVEKQINSDYIPEYVVGFILPYYFGMLIGEMSKKGLV